MLPRQMLSPTFALALVGASSSTAEQGPFGTPGRIRAGRAGHGPALNATAPVGPIWTASNQFSEEALLTFGPLACINGGGAAAREAACVADFGDHVGAMNAAGPRQRKAGHIGGCINDGLVSGCASRRIRRAGHGNSPVCVAVAALNCNATPGPGPEQPVPDSTGSTATGMVALPGANASAATIGGSVAPAGTGGGESPAPRCTFQRKSDPLSSTAVGLSSQEIAYVHVTARLMTG